MYLALLTTLTLALGTTATPTPWNEIQWISRNTSLPKVMIYSAGGTILSSSNYSRLDNVNYGSGYRVTPQDIIGNASEVLDVAQLGIQIFPTVGGSSGLNSSLYLNISQYANAQLCAEGSDIAGAIMFHGTNTLAETAFGVDMTFNCSKPFVATGAMRPHTYISQDGLSNFYQAVATAASPSSRNRGGMIVFNDRISSIYYTAKMNANTPDTFMSPEQGFLGALLGGQPYYFFGPSFPTGRQTFNVQNTTVLPSVITLWGHQGFDAELMYAAVKNGAKGLVIFGPGAGSLSPSARAAATELYAQGVPTVVVARPVTGAAPPGITPGRAFSSGYLNGDNSRILLQLALNAGYSLDEIRELFEAELRSVIYSPWANQIAYYDA